MLPDHKDRENQDYRYHGKGHPGDGADGEVEPEDFLGAVGEERQKPEIKRDPEKIILAEVEEKAKCIVMHHKKWDIRYIDWRYLDIPLKNNRFGYYE